MAVPVMDQAEPGTEAFSPVKPKSVEVDGGEKDEVDVANKGEHDCEGNANAKTPEESKVRGRVPRPFLEIETGEEDEMTSPDYSERRISLNMTPLSCKSTDSSAEYHHPNQTIIILDWDDTVRHPMELGNVMVIGGGGWVGSALVLELLRRREELGVSHVVVADLAGAFLVEKVLDVSRPEAVREALVAALPQTIFNLAAVIDLRPEVSQVLMSAVNTDAVQCLLKEITCERLIHFSTLDVAWDGQCLNAAPRPTEDLQVHSPVGYVRSKARGELQVHQWMAKTRDRVSAVVLRPAHIFGSYNDLDFVAADVLAGFLRKFPPVQLGPPTARMSLVSVPTVVEAAVRAAQNANKLSGRCLAVKDLDANFFRFYHQDVLGRRMWPLRLPGILVVLAALVEDLWYWLMSPWCQRHPVHCLTFHGVRQAFSDLVIDDAETWQSLGDYRCSRTKKGSSAICPSTTCMRQHGLSVMGPRPGGELARRLQVLAYEAKQLIEVAATLADKARARAAHEGWVNLSCTAWLPDLLETVEKCEVASARSQFEPTGISSPAGWKARAFEEVIERFYQRYPNQSWKNIISIGDAPHEREAWTPRCRSKSIKFVLRPSIEQLVRELHMLRDSLREIVLHDDDLDMHFCTETFADPLAC
eukprot:symbB.v1.2.039397.t2/scaffold6537.1/size17269/1